MGPGPILNTVIKVHLTMHLVYPVKVLQTYLLCVYKEMGKRETKSVVVCIVHLWDELISFYKIKVVNSPNYIACKLLLQNICRSATLSTMAELYGRSGVDWIFTGK